MLFPPFKSTRLKGRHQSHLFPPSMVPAAAVYLCILLTGTALATSNVSSDFDGRYHGTGRAIPWADHPPCADFDVQDLHIRKGMVAYRAAQEPPAINGFITAEGYFKTTLTLLGGARVPLEGRFSDGRMVAGAIDEASTCAWLLELTPAAD